MEIDNQRAAMGLPEAKLTVKEIPDRKFKIFSTISNRKVLAGLVDGVTHVVTERNIGPLGHPKYSVVMVNTAGAIAT